MFWDIQKFKNEIDALKRLKSQESLRPLRKEQIKAVIMSVPVPGAPEDGLLLGLAKNPHRFLRYIVSMIVGLSLFGGTALASQGSMPGDLLYPIKRASEAVASKMAITSNTRAKVEAKHAENRLNELERLEKNDRNEDQSKQNSNNIGIIPNSATTAIEAGSSVDSFRQNRRNQKNDSTKIQARLDAQNQFIRAINALSEVKSKLELKGNVQAAEAITKQIEDLKDKAQGLGFEAEIETEDPKSLEKGKENKLKIKWSNDTLKALEDKSEEKNREKSLDSATTTQGSSDQVEDKWSVQGIRVEIEKENQNRASRNYSESD